MTVSGQSARLKTLVIGGPTAGGKSGLAIKVAQAKNGAVINADSMQVYDGLPVLTAQPDAGERAQAPHHLYGALPPDDTCTAARWRDMALETISRVQDDGYLPIIVGGTGFYLKALLEGLSPIPQIPDGLREKLIAQAQEIGNAAFHAELQKADPAMALRLDPYNTQRMIRAMEVLQGTGKSLAAWQDMPRVPPPAHLHFITVTLIPEREALYRNCDMRFDMMLEKGAIKEAAAFKKKSLAASPLFTALGYPELSAHLDGTLSLEDARASACQFTRNYAKRQTTWFRNQITADIRLETSDTAEIFSALGL